MTVSKVRLSLSRSDCRLRIYPRIVTASRRRSKNASKMLFSTSIGTRSLGPVDDRPFFFFFMSGSDFARSTKSENKLFQRSGIALNMSAPSFSVGMLRQLFAKKNQLPNTGNITPPLSLGQSPHPF
jgi:hypothetical protein